MPGLTQPCQRRLDVVHLQSQVAARVGGAVALEQVHVVAVAELEPGQAGKIVDPAHADRLGIEGRAGVEQAARNLDGGVLQANGGHHVSVHGRGSPILPVMSEWVDPAQELTEIERWFAQRRLELELFERADGSWRAMVSPAGESKGAGEYVDGLDRLDAARRAQRRHSTRQLRTALNGLSQVAQSEVVQLLAAELLVARLPAGRSRVGRQAALASAVWMLDPKRRSATRVAGRVAGEWARLRLTNRPAPGLRSSAEPLLPAALGATERSLDKLRLRLQKPR